MIEPLGNLKLLDGHQRLRVSIRQYLHLRRTSNEYEVANDSEIDEKVKCIKNCEDRRQLESVLGAPCYAVDPAHYKVNGRAPVNVEVYHRFPHVYDILFFPDDETVQVIVLPVSPEMTRLDFWRW